MEIKFPVALVKNAHQNLMHAHLPYNQGFDYAINVNPASRFGLPQMKHDVFSSLSTMNYSDVLSQLLRVQGGAVNLSAVLPTKHMNATAFAKTSVRSAFKENQQPIELNIQRKLIRLKRSRNQKRRICEYELPVFSRQLRDVKSFAAEKLPPLSTNVKPLKHRELCTMNGFRIPQVHATDQTCTTYQNTAKMDFVSVNINTTPAVMHMQALKTEPAFNKEAKRSRTRKRSRKTCLRDECTKYAQGPTKFCVAHGGGRRCNFSGCTKSAAGVTKFCIGHGGGKRCHVPNCPKSAICPSPFCFAHGGGKRCKHIGCKKGARGSTDYCIGHGGGKRCNFYGCPRSGLVRGSAAKLKVGYCIEHSNRK
uniref:WRKY19-like zinc finger domain-containing protein n=1 Tax=Aplanochytrium stocchinoi TaxID=215587 RepID=A0A7S3PJV9_9STRA